MTMLTRLGTALLLFTATLPFATASVLKRDDCASNEFWYENKGCCVQHGMPPSPPSPPPGKNCPSSNWYWSDEQSCCIPSSPPPPENPAPTCPGNSNWDADNSWCNQPTPPSGPDNCDDNEFWYGDKNCCLPHGGPSNPPPPPPGNNCPSTGWYWGDDQGCCVPYHPNPPPPQCPSGWDWSGGDSCCQPGPPTAPPSHPSGYWKRSMKKREAALCPDNLEACPITGNSKLLHDYECLDTKAELESCGGCASTGAGQDCTSIKGAWNVGCENGSCKVYTCSAGYNVSIDGKTCIPML